MSCFLLLRETEWLDIVIACVGLSQFYICRLKFQVIFDRVRLKLTWRVCIWYHSILAREPLSLPNNIVLFAQHNIEQKYVEIPTSIVRTYSNMSRCTDPESIFKKFNKPYPKKCIQCLDEKKRKVTFIFIKFSNQLEEYSLLAITIESKQTTLKIRKKSILINCLN